MCPETYQVIRHWPWTSKEHTNRASSFLISRSSVNAGGIDTKWSLWNVGKNGTANKKRETWENGHQLWFWKKNILYLPLLQEETKIKNPGRCKRCKKDPDTQTTYERKITTLSGDRTLRIRLKYCKDHGIINPEFLLTIQKICPKSRTFDTKVTIAIGFLRWLFNYQREEIQLFLEVRGIHISKG